MNKKDKSLKRGFDVIFSILCLIITSWLIVVFIIIARFSTKLSGVFKQVRVGQYSKPFMLYKIRTMKKIEDYQSTITTSNDPRITKFGFFLRKYKLDELPQLVNIFLGQMSFVGPRPDVPGFADKLIGEDRIILSIKPGLTGPASIFFRNEELILSKQQDPELYNREVIWPEKIKRNKEYIKNYNFYYDIRYLIKTIFYFK